MSDSMLHLSVRDNEQSIQHLKASLKILMKEFSDFIKSRVHISETDLTIVLSKFKETTLKKGGACFEKRTNC